MPPSPPGQRKKLVALAGAVLAMLLAALDQTVVSTAGPTVQAALGIAPANYAWMTTAYLVAATVLVPISGRLSDLLGRRAVLAGGVLVFVVASGGCGLASGATGLMVFRALQGAGAAAIFTASFALTADLFPASERGRYSGVLASVFAVSSLLGPVLGGVLTDTLGWRWVFLVNLPAGAVALGLVLLAVPGPGPREGLERPGLDVPGTALLVLGVVPLLLALSLGRTVTRAGDIGWPWLSAPVLGLFAVAALGCLGFVLWEKRAVHPLLDLALFADPTGGWASALAFALGGVLLIPMIFLPLWLEHVAGVSATASGLTVSPLVLGTVAGNVLSGQVVTRLGRYRGFLVGAVLFLACALAFTALSLEPSSTQAAVSLRMVLLGLGLGPTIPLSTLAVQNVVDDARLGQATAAVTFARQLGATVGIAVAGSLFASTLSTRLEVALRDATAGLPAELKERVTQEGSALVPTSEGDPQGERFEGQKVKQRLEDQLEGARAFAERALDGEFLAARVVAGSPMADGELREAAAAGGAKALVHARLGQAAARLQAFAENPLAWDDVVKAPTLPQVLRQRWRTFEHGDMPTPAELMQELREQEDPEAQALKAKVLAALDARVAQSRPLLRGAIDRAEAGLHAGFTAATVVVFRMALVAAMVALLCALRLPDRKLAEGRSVPVVAE